VATLSLQQVTKVFPNGVEAVRGLELEVDEGEFLVLVGPSGCGKTTALRMVAGLEEVTSGTIRLDGKVVNDLSAKERDVAMVFQNYALYPHLNVLQNIAFSLRVRGVSKHERERKAREAADVLGLTEVVLRKPRQLSGGQRQRVAMGRALVREPSVFLMDEPLSNLDANLRVQMRSEVLRVQRRLGVATLYVTHDQTEAMTMGDRVALLRDGTLQQLAAPQELYENPANLFVATFIGSPPMNLYEGEISGPAARLVLSLGSQRLALPVDLGHRRPGLVSGEGRKLVVGIRPEHLTVVEGGDANQETTLAAHVELIEALGNESLVHFSTDARRVRNRGGAWTADAAAAQASGDIAGASAAEGVARVDPRVRVSAGERIAFAVDVGRLHFFDAETGDAIGAAGRPGVVQLAPARQQGEARG
jgi:multiple sugar transport system ATP-binding protein